MIGGVNYFPHRSSSDHMACVHMHTRTMIKCKKFDTFEIVKFSEINDRIQTTDKMTKFKNVSKEIIQSEELK